MKVAAFLVFAISTTWISIDMSGVWECGTLQESAAPRLVCLVLGKHRLLRRQDGTTQGH